MALDGKTLIVLLAACGGGSGGGGDDGGGGDAGVPSAICARPDLHDVSTPTAVVGDGTAASCTAAALQQAATGGGTLFERMSSIARGAPRAQIDDDEPSASFSREPLDIPRFLNRQNNQ
jgi:cell division protein FtsZ